MASLELMQKIWNRKEKRLVVSTVQLAHKVHREHSVAQDQEEWQVQKDNLVCQEEMEILDHQEKLGLLGHQVIFVSTDSIYTIQLFSSNNL